jgi:hypothetical protein
MNGIGAWQQLAWAVAWFLLSGACAYSYYRLSRAEVSLKKMRQGIQSVWGLKLEAREIKRCWPGSLFAQHPLDRIMWSPYIGQPETGMQGVVLERAIAWHDKFLQYVHPPREYPKGVDFDGLMALLDRDERVESGLPV